MTSLDSHALETDPEGLAVLRDVLGTAPQAPPRSRRQAPTASPEPLKSAMPRTTRRIGLVASTALIGLVAAAPAKSAVIAEQNAPPAATETRQEAPRETPPPPSRPVRTVTRYAALDADSPACPRVRRKLWVEGEGWIVRSVSRC